jgi:hypothetical protein
VAIITSETTQSATQQPPADRKVLGDLNVAPRTFYLGAGRVARQISNGSNPADEFRPSLFGVTIAECRGRKQIFDSAGSTGSIHTAGIDCKPTQRLWSLGSKPYPRDHGASRKAGVQLFVLEQLNERLAGLRPTVRMLILFSEFAHRADWCMLRLIQTHNLIR